MTKQEFIDELREKLSGLPNQETEERLNFYGEMIDDRLEECGSEEEAVAAIGSPDEIAEQILREIPLRKLARERIKPKRRLSAAEITLLALGSPIWLSLIIAAVAVAISLFAVMWSVVITVWSVFIAIAVCAPGCAVLGIIMLIAGSHALGIAALGAGMVCAGIAIFLLFGCIAVTKGILWLSRETVLAIKKSFIKKEKGNE